MHPVMTDSRDDRNDTAPMVHVLSEDVILRPTVDIGGSFTLECHAVVIHCASGVLTGEGDH